MAIADQTDGVTNGPFTLKLKTTIPEQLKILGLTPADIDYLGLSHTHFDHAGSAELFTNAKLIIQKTELETFTDNPEEAKSYHMQNENIDHFINSENQEQLIEINGDHDIFEDKSLTVLSLPGHTPGHQGLMINLQNQGTVILSGDQWHFTENYESNGVPSFNYDREKTLASSQRLNAIIENTNATLIIQHEPAHIKKIPAFPKYAD